MNKTINKLEKHLMPSKEKYTGTPHLTIIDRSGTAHYITYDGQQFVMTNTLMTSGYDMPLPKFNSLEEALVYLVDRSIPASLLFHKQFTSVRMDAARENLEADAKDLRSGIKSVDEVRRDLPELWTK